MSDTVLDAHSAADESEESKPAIRKAATPDAEHANREWVLMRGHVFDSAGTSAGEGIVVEATCIHASSGAFLRAATRADGSFVLKLSARVSWSPAWPRDALGVDGLVALTAIHGHAFRVLAFRPDRSEVSRALLYAFSEAGESLWAAVRLLAPAAIVARAVDGTGSPLPGARVRMLVSSGPDLPLWDHRAFLSAWHDVVADQNGMAKLRVPAHRVRAWARAAEGVFGASRRGLVKHGHLDVGDLVVGQGTVRFRFHVVDGAGDAVAGAGVRLEGEHAVQRWVGESQGKALVHYTADENGMVEFLLAAGEDPAVAGVAARGFLPVSLVMDRTHAGVFAHQVVLDRAPVLRVRIEAENGIPLPEKVKVPFTTAWQRADESFGPRGVPHRILHVGRIDRQAAANRLREMDPAPAWILDDSFASADPVYDRTRAEYVFTMRQPGRYLVRANVPPGFHVEGFGEARTVNQAPVVLRVPSGRVVTVGVGFPEGLSPGAAQLDRLHVWPATAHLPPDDWPANIAEARDAAQTTSPLLEDGALSAAIWLPSEFSHVAFRRIRLVVRSKRLAQRYTGPHRVPGAVRHAGMDERFRNLQPVRLRPEGKNPTVVLRVSPPRGWNESRKVRASVLLNGKSLVQAGMALQAKRVTVLPRHGAARKRSGVTTAHTDSTGIATFRLLPGQYQVCLDPRIGPSDPVGIVVPSDGDPAEVRVHFRAR